jgi:hypothetical protein
MAELVVLGTLLRILQDLVSLRGLAELRFRGLVAGIFIGVVLDGKLVIRLIIAFICHFVRLPHVV